MTTKGSRRKTTPSKKRLTEPTELGSCLKYTEIRNKLDWIINQIKTNKRIPIGKSEKLAYSMFVPIHEMTRNKPKFNLPPRDIDIEIFRKKRKILQDQVEYWGQPIRFLREGEPIGALIPTDRAIKDKATPTRHAMQILYKRDLQDWLTRIESQLHYIVERLPSSEQIEKINTLGKLALHMRREWRKDKGLPESDPDLPSAG